MALSASFNVDSARNTSPRSSLIHDEGAHEAVDLIALRIQMALIPMTNGSAQLFRDVQTSSPAE